MIEGFTDSKLSLAVLAIQEMLKQFGDGYLVVQNNGCFYPVIKMSGAPGMLNIDGKEMMAVIIEIGDSIQMVT